MLDLPNQKLHGEGQQPIFTSPPGDPYDAFPNLETHSARMKNL